jgi:Tfp pilus assembly protein PilO
MSSNDRTLLLAAPLLVALVAVWFMVISPKKDQVSKLDAQVASLRSDVAGQRASIAQGLKAQKRFPRSYHRLVVAGKAVPVNDETASLLVQIDRAAKAAGVGFEGISQGDGGSGTSSSSSTTTATTAPTTSTTAPGLTALPYSLSFRGTFFQISDFISRVDRLVDPKGNRIASDGRLTIIDSFTLGPDEPRPLPALLSTVNITTYLAGPDPTAASPTGSATSTETAAPSTGSSSAATTPASTSTP